VGKAILAVLLPIIVMAVLIFVFAESITGIPIIGAVASTGISALLICEIGPMLLGGIIGGLLS